MPRAKQQQSCGPMEARVSTRVPVEFKDSLKNIATRLGVSVSDVVRGCLAKADPREVEQWCQLDVEWKPPTKRATKALASIEAQQLALLPPQVAKRTMKEAKKIKEDNRSLSEAKTTAQQIRQVTQSVGSAQPWRLDVLLGKLERGELSETEHQELKDLTLAAAKTAARKAGKGKGRVSDKAGRSWSVTLGNQSYRATLKRDGGGLVMAVNDSKGKPIADPETPDLARQTVERFTLPNIVAVHWVGGLFPTRS